MALLLGPHYELLFTRRGTRTQFFYERPSSEIAKLGIFGLSFDHFLVRGMNFFLIAIAFQL